MADFALQGQSGKYLAHKASNIYYYLPFPGQFVDLPYFIRDVILPFGCPCSTLLRLQKLFLMWPVEGISNILSQSLGSDADQNFNSLFNGFLNMARFLVCQRLSLFMLKWEQ